MLLEIQESEILDGLIWTNFGVTVWEI